MSLSKPEQESFEILNDAEKYDAETVCNAFENASMNTLLHHLVKSTSAQDVLFMLEQIVKEM
jgi:hypothetical protein